MGCGFLALLKRLKIPLNELSCKEQALKISPLATGGFMRRRILVFPSTQLPPPQNIHGESAGPNSVNLYADPVPGASGYTFFQRTAPDQFGSVSGVLPTPAFTINSLVTGVEKEYRVLANGNNNPYVSSLFSASVFVTPSGTPPTNPDNGYTYPNYVVSDYVL